MIYLQYKRFKTRVHSVWCLCISNRIEAVKLLSLSRSFPFITEVGKIIHEIDLRNQAKSSDKNEGIWEGTLQYER